MHGFSDLISSWHGISLFQFRILQGCIFFKYPPIQYSQFFQVNGEGFQDITYAWRAKRRERGRKRGRGEEKRGRGEEKGERGRKKRERGRKKMLREGKKIFFKVLGKVFNSIMC